VDFFGQGDEVDAMSVQTVLEPGALVAADTIPLCVPEIRGKEWEYVKECLDTSWVSYAGGFVDRFESTVAGYVGSDFAVATASGTAALHMALVVAGIGADDEVLMPALTFVAPANAVRYVGAWPVFIDVEPDYWQMDPHKVSDFVEQECNWLNGALINKSTGRRVKAILPVHILGHPVDMDPILEIGRRFELTIVEDATESLGARYKDRSVGQLGDIACFSFNGNKIITTGGGGMITTNNETWARKAKYLTTQAKDDPVEYIHNEIGYNYRLTNIQAAVGCAQMEQLDDYVAAKRRINSAYRDAFSDTIGLSLHQEAPGVLSSNWMSAITVHGETFGHESRALMRQLDDQKIQTRPLWHPVNSLPPFANCQAYNIDVSNLLYRTALNLPSSVGLTQTDQDRVIEAVCAARAQR
jgi:perosamine synthetase